MDNNEEIMVTKELHNAIVVVNKLDKEDKMKLFELYFSEEIHEAIRKVIESIEKSD